MTRDRQPTVAQRLFYDRWEVLVPEIYLYSKEYLEQAGSPTSGDKDIDRTLMQSKVPRLLPIVGMAMLYDEGAQMTLQRPEDAVEIYKLLRQHLDNWHRVVTEIVNKPKVPIEDLQVLDRFAGAIHPLALRYAPVGGFDGVFSRFNRMGASRLGTLLAPKVETKPEVKPPVETHSPIADAIARHAFNRG